MITVTVPAEELAFGTEKDFRFIGLTASNEEKDWKSFTFTTDGTIFNGNHYVSIIQNEARPTSFRVKSLANVGSYSCSIRFDGVNDNDEIIEITQVIELTPVDSDPIVTGTVEVTPVP